MLDSHYDVLIAGGGPAGLRTAAIAARAGAHVAVLERNAAFGIPVRTSGASSIRELTRLGVPARFWHPIHTIRFLSPTNEAVFHYDEPLACVLDVRAFFQHLAAEAAMAGATLALKTTAIAFAYHAGQACVRIRTDNQERTLTADLVVDATGHAAHLARESGLAVDRSRYGIGEEWDVYAPHFDEEQLLLLVGSQVAPAGYAWAFPYGNHRVRVGVGILRPDSPAHPHTYLQNLPERAPALAPMLQGAQPIEVHSGAFPSVPPNATLAADRLLIVGDAGAQGSTLVGEGIRFALMAADFAGATIARARAANDYSAAFLRTHYERPWRQRWGRSMAISYAINQVIAGYDDQTWDDRVELMKSLSPELFAEALHADFSLGLLLRLAGRTARRPRLLANAVRKLARASWRASTGRTLAATPSGDRP